MANTDVTIEDREDFDNNPEDQYSYWNTELSAAMKMVRTWHKTGDNIVNRYLGDPIRGAERKADSNAVARLNLFNSNVTTLESMLYGNTPKIDVSRRYADPDDDVARVAAEAMERLLNLDASANGDQIDAVFKSTLQDRLLSGLGTARLRYDVETMETATGKTIVNDDGVEVEEMAESVVDETAPMDYIFWGDVLWSWSRNWSEVRWIAFRNYLTKEEIKEKFGEHASENIALKKQTTSADEQNSNTSGDDSDQSAWEKGEIWEIWDKDKRQVVWVALGYDKVLKTQADPLQLSNFFPCPPFLLANPTTRQLMPRPDFKLCEDLYNEIDLIHYRITILTQAVKAVGVYDAGAGEGVQRVFTEGTDNKLIPMDNWALFGEKGGLAGVIDWVPIKDIVEALDKLRDLRAENIQLLQQISGMADVMRGSLDNQYEGVGQSQMKAKFGSIRVQALQDQFALFASGLMQIKAEIISRHFSPETIARMSNMAKGTDKDLLPKAIALIKDTDEARLRVTIRPESVAMVDYAALKDERVGFMNALATFMQSAAPLIEADPAAKPYLMQLLQWSLSGFKGAQEIEGVMDKAIKASLDAQKEAEANPQQEPSDAQMRMAEINAKGQLELQKFKLKIQGDMQLREQDMQADMATTQREHEIKMAEIMGQLEAKLSEINAKMRADITTEQVQTEANILQNEAANKGEMQKDVLEAELESVSNQEGTASEISKIAATAQAKISEETVKAAIDKEKIAAQPEPSEPKNV